MSDVEREDRREFLRTVARTAVLGLLALGTGALLARRREDCINDGICRGCTAFGECGLPQALSAKRASSREGPWRATPTG